MIQRLMLAFAALALASAPASARHSYGGGRVHYSGSSHTSSHGGHYFGGSGSSHRGGHYVNARTGNHYGCHRCR
jgi:hypothetical protein